MTAIDDLLTRSLLLSDPQVPSDAVPYEETVFPAFTSDSPSQATPLCDSYSDQSDDTAARTLRALCEVAVTRSPPGHLVDFITEQLPAPRGAWILGCLLQLADAEDGARFWWQYAAGAGNTAASYTLYLHHLALGDNHAAAFWREQSSLDNRPDTIPASPAGTSADSLNVDTSIPTLLRVLSHLTPTPGRGHTEATVAAMEYVAAAVADGYARHPSYEIPLPGPHFAEQIEIILAVTARAMGTSRRRSPAPSDLPSRQPPGTHTECGQEPERVLVEVEAMDDESFLKEAIAACWETPATHFTAHAKDQPVVRLSYYLTQRPLMNTLAAPCT